MADASFGGQPDGGSQAAYMLSIGGTHIAEGRARTQLIDWKSGKIHRKGGSTIAGEANAARQAYGRAMYARMMFF